MRPPCKPSSTATDRPPAKPAHPTHSRAAALALSASRHRGFKFKTRYRQRYGTDSAAWCMHGHGSDQSTIYSSTWIIVA
jgi:hypothetical protein